jgi:uncharacterized protein DUF4157
MASDKTDKTVQVAPPVLGTANPIPQPLLTNMETTMGRQFDDVRVYESHSATMLGAQSYTHGREIFFAPGHYQPHSEEGQKLIAHELTHVVQQGQQRLNVLAENLVERHDTGEAASASGETSE